VQASSQRRYLLAAAFLTLVDVRGARAEVCTADGVCVVVEADPDNELARVLRERSNANKEVYDQRRLDSFYERRWRLNALLRREVLPEPCDPRLPEFRTKCMPNNGLLPPEALQ
jgi:hypothetical protein